MVAPGIGKWHDKLQKHDVSLAKDVLIQPHPPHPRRHSNLAVIMDRVKATGKADVFDGRASCSGFVRLAIIVALDFE